jgi:quercetin dioxygenase-like cupin family protein
LALVQSWNLMEIDAPSGTRDPMVVHSGNEARAVVIVLTAGQKLGDHQVKEHAFLVVVDGSAQIEAAGETLDAAAGTMVAFDPDERRVVASDSGAKILLMLAPWPGEGHYRGEKKSV